MVVKVKLEGLKIVKGRQAGTWYVYVRDTMEPLLKGFEGTREQLMARLGEPDMIGAYNARRKRNLNRVYPEGTLGALIAWFQNECAAYTELSARTKKDYGAAFEWLRPEYDCPLDAIDTRSMRCATAAQSRRCRHARRCADGSGEVGSAGERAAGRQNDREGNRRSGAVGKLRRPRLIASCRLLIVARLAFDLQNERDRRSSLLRTRS
jgi:hypothetical protein